MKQHNLHLTIKNIVAREILDSRGIPTIETKITLSNGITSQSSVPSGASTGVHECLELRDNDPKRYQGKGVLKAIHNINEIIAKKFKNKKIQSLGTFDDAMLEMDGTQNKSHLGANAILSVSMALTRALAFSENVSLYTYLRKTFFQNIKTWNMPKCMMNIINGGAHGNWASDFQEYMIIPNFSSVLKQVQSGSEVFHSLQNQLHKRGLAITLGDEGGFSPKMKNNIEPMEWILNAIKDAGYDVKNISLALDIASSEFHKDNFYLMRRGKEKKSSEDMICLYKEIIHTYPVISIEDGLSEDDWDGWRKMTQILGKKIYLIGDDLFVTNIQRIKTGIKNNIANGVLIKLNQIGSVSETIQAIQLAKDNHYIIAISHRSGETLDDFISDLSVASQAQFLKAGSLSRGERVAKYNRLMEIEEEIYNS